MHQRSKPSFQSTMPNRPLTVVQILPELESGGVERGTLEISRALVQRGHRSVVVSAGGRLVERLIADGGVHLTLDTGRKSPLTLLNAGRLRKLLTELPADLVHVRSRMPAWVTLLAWRSMRPPERPRLVTTVHGLNSVNWYSKVMTRGEQVIAVSDCCRSYVLNNYPTTDPARVTTIHRGVSSDEFPYGFQPPAEWIADWRTEYPQLIGRLVVLLVGRITRFKGHFDFLQVIQQLKSLNIPVHGLIVGGEDPRRQRYADSVHAEVQRLALGSDVTFTGRRADVREIMSVSDVVLSTSIEPPESFGRTVLEAVKLGRPTVGYAHGGVGEVLGTVYPDGRVPPHDTGAMAAKIAAIHRGELAGPPPTRRFELSQLLDEEIDLYESLVATPRAA
jgi:glycosyltransferase involved in cell wall biosynthesis